MRYLVDTDILLRTLFEPSRISEEIIRILEDSALVKYTAMASFWEIAETVRDGKLVLKDVSPEELFTAAMDAGFQILTCTPEDVVTSYRLPERHAAGTVFARLIVWQAIQNRLVLLTHDVKLSVYRPDGLQMI
ncbi:MAG: type II toxin-antitoxin system VapC family toxin [Spirochaetota bacterium]